MAERDVPQVPHELQVLQLDKADGVWTATLNRPDKRNALSAALVEALIDTVAQATRAGVQVLALRGEGKCFSAGFDFSDLEAQSEGDLLLRFVRIETLLQQLAQAPFLTAAFTHGRNFGAGVDLAAVCRYRVCTPDASFRMPGLKFGLLLGTRRFAGIVGCDAAGRILQEAATFDAQQALAMGFVHELAATPEWDAILAAARAKAAALPAASRAALYATLDPGRHDADMASLVRSAAEPGLKARIHAYLVEPVTPPPASRSTHD